MKDSPEVDRATVKSLSKDLSTMSSELEELTRHLLSGLGDDLAMSGSWEATEPAVFTLLKSSGGETFEVKNLDERLTNLEGVVGEPGNDFKMSSLQKLSDLDVLVNPSKMKSVETRIKALSQHLDRLKRSSHMLKYVLTKRTSEKPDKLLNKMSRWDKIINELPSIINRLQTQ